MKLVAFRVVAKMAREFLSLIILIVKSSVCMRTSENGLYTDITVQVDKDIVTRGNCIELKENIQVIRSELYYKN